MRLFMCPKLKKLYTLHFEERIHITFQNSNSRHDVEGLRNADVLDPEGEKE